MYGYRNFIANHFRKTGLDSWRNLVSLWLCAFLALSTQVGSSAPYPWYCQPGSPYWLAPFWVARSVSHFYTEAELISIYSPYLPSNVSSVSDMFVWMEEVRGSVVLPVVGLLYGTYRLEEFAEDYYFSTNQLLYGSFSVVQLEDIESRTFLYPYLIPGWYSMRYGFGGYESSGQGLAYSSQPAFGDFYLPYSVTNIFNHPYGFDDWQEPGPLVWSRVALSNDFIQSASWFSGGYLGVVDAFYYFPSSPYDDRFSERGQYPVRLSDAASMVDERYLPFYHQLRSGCVVWTAQDSVKIRNVLRFSSPTNHGEGF